jgi:hypothetical protein
MSENTKYPLYLGVAIVQDDLGVSRAKAYNIIKKMNEDMAKKYPEALIVNGKVNRFWYEKASLQLLREGA